MNKRHCIGCEDDFYNGKNEFGIQECWHLKHAKLIMRRPVGVWEVPPWRAKPERKPDCYRQKGVVFVKPDQER